nr:hypothetical protein [Tanacetum cinerariifolium]
MVGSTMRIPLLYRGECSQWRKRFLNYLEEQMDEKKTQKIDRLARSLLIQGLPNDIYSLIDSNETAKDLWGALERQMRGSEGEYSQWRKRFMNYLDELTDGEAMINSIQNDDPPLPVIAQVNETAKDLWDALERQMRGSEYGEQDRKATILYEYETFKALEGEQFLDTYFRYLQQNQDDVNDALGYKKKAVVVTLDSLALVAEKTKVSKQKEKVVVSSDSEGSGADDFSELKKITALLAKAFIKENCKKVKVKDYNYYKTKMLLAKKDSDKQVLLAEDQAWMKSSSDSDKKINANMVFMAQIEKVLSESNKSSSSSEETIAESEVDHNDSEEKEHLVDKLIRKINHKIAKCQKRIKKANQQSKI